MRRIVSLLLTLLLLLSQQMTLAHAVGHSIPDAIAAAADASASDTPEPGAHACHLCSAAAQFASVLPCSPADTSAPPPCAAQPGVAPACVGGAATRRAFDSRAPPAR